ncbi:uncharacterized protein LOC131619541 [Vicia villosa]|uniref:uncharacterized protein LOC131619541 n=1 Tax=Vicia villosa TaxID=3911 RepID=UPI00273BCD36|nr:uncharacterized protein LOC131619541 [Vicia villosa]
MQRSFIASTNGRFLHSFLSVCYLYRDRIAMKKIGVSRINPNDPSYIRQKKAKLIANEKQNPRKFSRLEPDHSHTQFEKENVATCDPKTSEYAFFKKLKKDASLKFSSGLVKEDGSLSSKKSESGECSKERTVDVRVGTMGCNSSKINKNLSTFKMDSFLSPSVGAWNKSDMYSMSSKLKSSQGFGDTKPQRFSQEGNQNEDGDIFSRKRQKLRQCVADTLFLNTEKLCSKGLDIVSMLLSRLFPMSTDCTVKNKYKEANPEKIETATRYDLLDYQESDSDVQFKEHYLVPKRKFLELESAPYFNDQPLSPMFLESGERTTPHTEFLTYHPENFQPRYSITAPNCKRSESPSFSASVKGDITLAPLFNEKENATKYSLLDSREFDFQCTELHQIPKRKLLELESSSCINDHLLSPMFHRPAESITPRTEFPIYPRKFQPMFRTEAESEFGGTPSYLDKNELITPHTEFQICPYKFRPMFRTEAESEFGGTSSYLDKNDVTRGFLYYEQKHETFSLDHFKELGKLEREPIPLLMGEDFNCEKDEIKLPISCKYAKPYLVPDLSILDHGEEQISNNALGDSHFSPSSLILNKPQDFNSVLDSGLLSYQKSQFGKHVYEDDDEDMDTNFNHAALSLSHNKHCFKFSEKCKKDISYVQDSIYLPPYHHFPYTEAWLSSSPRCLSLTSSQSNYQTSITRNLQLPESENMSSLFHIDDHYEPKIHGGGGDHGEVLYHLSEAFVEIYNSSFLHMSLQRDNGCAFSLDDRDNINDGEEMHKMLL